MDCHVCGAYFISSDHKCKPAWQVINKELHDNFEDGVTVYSSDAEEAAEKGSEKLDDRSGEHDDKTVLVRNSAGEIFEFDVECRAEPCYYARAVKDK